MPEQPAEVIARHDDASGEVVLRRRGDVLELVVDGVFAMDSVHTATERALATVALKRLAADHLRVFVAGLGLGYTCQALLEDPRVRRLTVVELHPAVVHWARQGLVEPAGAVVADPRVHVRVADVLDAVPTLPRGGLDAVLLDVDNGPGFLTHPGNTAVYSPPFLHAAARALRSGGVLGVWSAESAPDLALALERACGACDEVLFDVARDGREFTYAVYLGQLL